MKSILVGIALTIVIAVISWAVLQSQKESSSQAFSSPDVRLN
jgi:hypothetical protein